MSAPKWLIVTMGIFLLILICAFVCNNNDTDDSSSSGSHNRKPTVRTDFPEAILYSTGGDITVEDVTNRLLDQYENDIWGEDRVRILKFGTITSAELEYDVTDIDTLYAIFHIEISYQEGDTIYHYQANATYLQEGTYGEYYYTFLKGGLGPKEE